MLISDLSQIQSDNRILFWRKFTLGIGKIDITYIVYSYKPCMRNIPSEKHRLYFKKKKSDPGIMD